VTLVYQLADVFGDVPTEAAQRHLVDVLRARLFSIGEKRANIAVTATGALTVIVTTDGADAADAEMQRDAEVRFRIRAPSDIENAEREMRDELGEFYRPSRTDFAWVTVERGVDVFLYVPEAPLLLEIERLSAQQPPDENAVREKILQLKKLLLQKVFAGSDLSDAAATHLPGDSAVRVTIREDRRQAFREYTTHYTGRQLVALVNGHVVAAPTIPGPLESAAELRNPARPFTQAEADLLAETLRRAAYGTRLVRLR